MECEYCGGHWETEYVYTDIGKYPWGEIPCCAMSEYTERGMTENEARKAIIENTKRFVMEHPGAYKHYYYDRPEAPDIPF